jgi:C4-dicarboxylate-specific signal transduction histidine kinase
MLLMIAFFLGPMFLSNLWGYLQSRRYLTEAAFRNIRNVAALEASETREFVRAAQNLIPSIVAGNQYLFRILRGFEHAEREDERKWLSHELRAHLVAKAVEGGSVDEFQVMSREGVLLASSDARHAAGLDLFSSRCFQRGRERNAVVGFDYGDAPSGQQGHHESSSPGHHESGAQGHHDEPDPRLLVAGPIRDSRGAFLGVFCARFAFDIHRKLLLAHQERTNQAMLYLLDEDGRIVCGSFEETHGAPYGDRFQTPERPIFPPNEAWEGRYRISSGEEVMVAYAPVPKLNWGVAVEVPVVRALADLQRLSRQAMAGSVLLATVLAVAAYLVWRMVVRPIGDLSQTSDRIATGTPGETVSPGGPREILELATAFNRMSLALRDSHESLESRIAHRTRELRESQEFAELLLDSIDQRVVVVNADYEIIKANTAAARMHGENLIGKRSCDVFEGIEDPPEDYPARRTFETGQPASDERSQRTLHRLEPVYIETYPVLDANDRVESVVEIGRVVTAEKRLQMQMVYQEKMAAFGQLAAGVAHEIGNPLAAIESQLRMAQGDPSRMEQTLEVVRKQVGRMDRMVRRLVDFTRRRRDEAMLASGNQADEDVAQLLPHDRRRTTWCRFS